ncbi:hypothetical protein [Neobacillus drentensis]|uniref:hypothetical protein n=1 Tax=Neobacillus drentensis TaxID=220684 RepID=UPI003B588B30
MDHYQVGGLNPIDPYTQQYLNDFRHFGHCGGGFHCGGFRCGGFHCGGFHCGGFQCGGFRCGGFGCGGFRCGIGIGFI